MKKIIDFEILYNSLDIASAGQYKRLPIDSALGIYYGLSQEGNLRLSLMSKSNAHKIESTKLLKVTQGRESQEVFWTCFDLLQVNAKKVFFAFCVNLIEAIAGLQDEQEALYALKKRYLTWKSMFKHNGSKISHEVLQGLYGELYFMKNYMIEKYGVASAIQSWSGPDAHSKDYAIGAEWYEIKTVGANAPIVRISSLAQLSSKEIGHLVILRVEQMAELYSDGESSVGELFQEIFPHIKDETLEEVFLSKLGEYGFDMTDESFSAKFSVKSMTQYRVDDEFPRLTEADIPQSEICDVGYSLIIKALGKYAED